MIFSQALLPKLAGRDAETTTSWGLPPTRPKWLVLLPWSSPLRLIASGREKALRWVIARFPSGLDPPYDYSPPYDSA